MSSGMTLDPRFSLRIQEVFGLKTAPLSLDDLKTALGEQVAVGGFNIEALFARDDTLHQVQFGGEIRHTHCALDALMLPFLTGREVNLRSKCPHCGDITTVEATFSGFRSSHPQAVLSLGVSRRGKGLVQKNACPFINLFPSQEHYKAWAAERRDALTVMLSLEEAAWLISRG